MFDCNYCGVAHEDSERGREHIVAEKLGNKNVVLMDTCAYWNNFFACSFENEIINGRFMGEALLRSVPENRPKGEKPLGPVQRADGETLQRWMVNGKEELRHLPQPKHVQAFNVPALDEHGATHEVAIAIPEELVVEIQHLPPRQSSYENRARRKLADSLKAVEEYIVRVTRDPSLDPALQAELTARRLTLQPVKSLTAEVKRIPGAPPQTIDDLVPQNHAMSIDALTKFFLKIGWCFSCLRLGRQRLIELGGDLILDHLQAGNIDLNLVGRVRAYDRELAEQLFRDATVCGQLLYFWVFWTVTDPLPLIAKISDAQLRDELHALAQQRRDDANACLRIVPGLRPRSLTELPPGVASRHHTLELVYMSTETSEAIHCRIVLFGGLFEVAPQMTRAVPVGSPRIDLGAPERIDF